MDSANQACMKKPHAGMKKPHAGKMCQNVCDFMTDILWYTELNIGIVF